MWQRPGPHQAMRVQGPAAWKEASGGHFHLVPGLEQDMTTLISDTGRALGWGQGQL